MEKSIKYIIYKEEKHYVARCLNVEVSSFGDTVEEAMYNIKEAVELYFEDEGKEISYVPVDIALLGETTIHV